MITTQLGTNISYLDSKLAYASTPVVFVTAVAMEGYDRTTLKVCLSLSPLSRKGPH